MIFLKALCLIFLAGGVLTVAAAKWAVKRFALDQKTKCDFKNEMSGEELAQYTFNKAVVNLKMLGMLIALPGIILTVIVF